MNQRDGFNSGFIAGTVVGGVVGGLIGALLASQRSSELAEDTESRRNASLPQTNSSKRQRRQFKAANSEQGIEMARRSLEDKIAQLNETIDEVRLTLGQVKGERSEENPESTLLREDLR